MPHSIAITHEFIATYIYVPHYNIFQQINKTGEGGSDLKKTREIKKWNSPYLHCNKMICFQLGFTAHYNIPVNIHSVSLFGFAFWWEVHEHWGRVQLQLQHKIHTIIAGGLVTIRGTFFSNSM